MGIVSYYRQAQRFWGFSQQAAEHMIEIDLCIENYLRKIFTNRKIGLGSAGLNEGYILQYLCFNTLILDIINKNSKSSHSAPFTKSNTCVTNYKLEIVIRQFTLSNYKI